MATMTIEQASELVYEYRRKEYFKSPHLKQQFNELDDAKKADTEAFWRRNATLYAERIDESIKKRDIQWLSNVVSTRNPITSRIFSAFTGVELPKNNKGILSAMREWFGPQEWDAHFDRRRREAAEQADAEKRERETKLRDAALATKIRWTKDGESQPQVTPIRELIDHLIESGYTPVDVKQGCMTTIRLLSEDGSTFYPFKRKYEMQYIRERYAARMAEFEQAVSTPDRVILESRLSRLCAWSDLCGLSNGIDDGKITTLRDMIDQLIDGGWRPEQRDQSSCHPLGYIHFKHPEKPDWLGYQFHDRHEVQYILDRYKAKMNEVKGLLAELGIDENTPLPGAVAAS